MPYEVLNGYWGLAVLYGALAGGTWALRNTRHYVLNGAILTGIVARAVGRGVTAGAIALEDTILKLRQEDDVKRYLGAVPLVKKRRLSGEQKKDHPLEKGSSVNDPLKLNLDASRSSPGLSLPAGIPAAKRAELNDQWNALRRSLDELVFSGLSKSTKAFAQSGLTTAKTEPRMPEEHVRETASERKTDADKQDAAPPAAAPAAHEPAPAEEERNSLVEDTVVEANTSDLERERAELEKENEELMARLREIGRAGGDKEQDGSPGKEGG
jgi:hypothetical protein